MSLRRPPKIVTSVVELSKDKMSHHICIIGTTPHSLLRAKHLMSMIQRKLGVRRLGFTTTLAQTPGDIGGGKGAVEIEISRRFCYVRRDGEIGRFVRRQRVLRR
jgi:hypothetical protein